MILENGYRLINLTQYMPLSSSSATSSYFKAEDGSTEGGYYYERGSNDGFFGWQMARDWLYNNDSTYVNKCGTYCGVSNGTRYYIGASSTTSYPYSGVIFGDGNTPPEATDYKLSGNMITDFSAVITVTRQRNADGLIYTFTYNITNTGASDLTIRELAVTIPNIANTKRILLSRSLLSTPVTIEPGQTGVVTYVLEIS